MSGVRRAPHFVWGCVFSLRLELCQICDSKQFFLEHDRMGTLNSKNGSYLIYMYIAIGYSRNLHLKYEQRGGGGLNKSFNRQMDFFY